MKERIIKFRYYVQHDASGDWRKFEYMLDEIAGTDRHEIAKVDNTIRWDERGIVQFVGLYDRHGTEIFEGDILQLVGEADLYVVAFSRGCFCVRYLSGDFEPLVSGNSYEIIGNIYENENLIDPYIPWL